MNNLSQEQNERKPHYGVHCGVEDLRRRSLREYIYRMFEEKLPLDQISRITGLSMEDIEELEDEYKWCISSKSIKLSFRQNCNRSAESPISIGGEEQIGANFSKITYPAQ